MNVNYLFLKLSVGVLGKTEWNPIKSCNNNLKEQKTFRCNYNNYLSLDSFHINAIISIYKCVIGYFIFIYIYNVWRYF